MPAASRRRGQLRLRLAGAADEHEPGLGTLRAHAGERLDQALRGSCAAGSSRPRARTGACDADGGAERASPRRPAARSADVRGRGARRRPARGIDAVQADDVAPRRLGVVDHAIGTTQHARDELAQHGRADAREGLGEVLVDQVVHRHDARHRRGERRRRAERVQQLDADRAAPGRASPRELPAEPLHARDGR